jgi:hypothetical protein
LEQATAELNLSDNTQIFPKRYNNIQLEPIKENTEPIDDQESTLEEIQKANSLIPNNDNLDKNKETDIETDKEQDEQIKSEEENEQDSAQILRRPNISITNSIPIENSTLNDSKNNINKNYLNEPPPRLSQLTFKSNSNEPPKYSSNRYKNENSNVLNNDEDQNSE